MKISVLRLYIYAFISNIEDKYAVCNNHSIDDKYVSFKSHNALDTGCRPCTMLNRIIISLFDANLLLWFVFKFITVTIWCNKQVSPMTYHETCLSNYSELKQYTSGINPATNACSLNCAYKDVMFNTLDSFENRYCIQAEQNLACTAIRLRLVYRAGFT